MWNEIILDTINRRGPVLNLFMTFESRRLMIQSITESDFIINIMKKCETDIRNTSVNYKKTSIGYLTTTTSCQFAKILYHINSITILHIIYGDMDENVLYKILKDLKHLKEVIINLKNEYDGMKVVEILADKATTIEVNFAKPTTFNKANIAGPPTVEHLTLTEAYESRGNNKIKFNLFDSSVVDLFIFIQPSLKYLKFPFFDQKDNENERLRWYNMLDLHTNNFEFSFLHKTLIDSDNIIERVKQVKKIDNVTISVSEDHIKIHRTHIRYICQNLSNLKNVELSTDSPDGYTIFIESLTEDNKIQVHYTYL